jgi:hypothetical protein
MTIFKDDQIFTQKDVLREEYDFRGFGKSDESSKGPLGYYSFLNSARPCVGINGCSAKGRRLNTMWNT